MMQEIMQFISRHPILSLAWIALLIAVIILTFKGLFAKTKNITRAQAIQLINKEQAISIDLRSRDDFRKGHIIDSINLTPSEIKDNNIGELEKHKQKPIIVVSANGMEASKPAEQLVQYCFERVFILKEGITGWSSENLPLASGKK
uniref:Thiosulfate sulfurtransferase GlpE n=1 Tax=Arsenophonus endosymbiont of Trialeurodes vaporariorum TaxID=235567 RepID=A0A3B0MBE9_9GAMM